MPLTCNIDENPYCDSVNLFACDEISIDPGVTILCGCNGAGKSTLLEQIARGLGYMTETERHTAALANAIKQTHVPSKEDDSDDTCNGANDEKKDGKKPDPTVILWNAVKGRDGFIKKAFEAFDIDDISYGFEISESSEGEGTMMALGRLGRNIASETSGSESGAPIVLLLDAIDSGLDEANMQEFRSFMGFVSEKTNEKGHDFYLVITTNSWPMTQEWKADAGIEPRCVLVPSLEPFDPSDYPSWRKTMLSSAKRKQKRDGKLHR